MRVRKAFYSGNSTDYFRGWLSLLGLSAVLLFSAPLSAQNAKLSGKVTDAETGMELIGVILMVEGTQTGTVTGHDGSYTIDAPPNGRITASLIGYTTQTVAIDKNTRLNIKLEPSAFDIDEVVTIAYGGQVKKSNLTSAMSVLGEKDIEKTPLNSIEQALQGNAAGVLVINTSGEPGAEITMRIRGGSSPSASNEPLVVIDGFPADNSALTMLNTNDVKGIEVLKDADATAIFGSRGANGVLMITTKSGESPKPTVNVKASLGVNTARRLMPMMDGPQFSEYDNFGRMVWGINSLRTARPDTVATSNFQEMLLRDVCYRQEYTVNLSGQSKEKDIKYYISAGFLDNDGILVNSSEQKMSYRGKFNFKLRKNIDFQLISSASRVMVQKIGGGGTGAILRTLMYNPAGTYNGKFDNGVFIDEETGEVLSVHSEISRAMNGNNWDKQFSTDVSGQLNWKWNKYLTFTSTGQYKYSDKRSYSYMPRWIFQTEPNLDKNNKATRGATAGIQWVNENYFNYNRTFKKKHSLGVTLGQTWQKNTSEGFGLTVRRFDTDYYFWDNLAAASYFDTPSSSKSQYTLLSFFGRAMYNYQERYHFKGTFRADGSSRFGEDRKFGYFPSVSGAWSINKEEFMRGTKNWLDELKLRITWGITGNDRIGNNNSLSLLTSTSVMIQGQKYEGQKTSQIGNPNLQWETERQVNAGLDLVLFRGRVTFSTDIYHKKTFNQLYAFRLPQTVGYSTVMANIGSTSNKGIEFELSTRNIRTKSFSWSTDFNVGLNRNRVDDLGGNDQVLLYYLGDNVNQNITYLIKGEPQAVFKGYKTSIYKSWEEVYADDAVWIETNVPTIPGMLKYDDRNGDGKIDDDDLHILGQAQPWLMGGFTNTFKYRNLTLVVFFNGAYGGSVVNTNVSKLMRFKAGSENQMRYMMDVWRPVNTATGDQGYANGKYAIPSSNSYSPSTGRDFTANLTDQWVEDASYLRLKTISLTYNVPDKISRMLGVGKINLSATGVNLLTFTKYTGYDPEMSSSQGSSAAKLGVDLSSYPPIKTIMFTMNINF